MIRGLAEHPCRASRLSDRLRGDTGVMKIERIRVDPADNKALIECPQCGAKRFIVVDKYRGTRRRVKTRCRCGAAFVALFEFRKATRKESSVQGYYAKLSGEQIWQKMLVTNVSISGIGFLAQSVHHLSPGDQVKVRFTLDGATRATVEKTAVVKWIEEIHVGCEFLYSVGGYDDRHEDAPLNIYLRTKEVPR
jgi:hypothetical protein